MAKFPTDKLMTMTGINDVPVIINSHSHNASHSHSHSRVIMTMTMTGTQTRFNFNLKRYSILKEFQKASMTDSDPKKLNLIFAALLTK